MLTLEQIGQQAKTASYALQALSTKEKNNILKSFSASLITRSQEIVTANEQDLEAARANGMSPSMVDRLMLDDSRIREIAESLLTLIDLEDPVGKVDRVWKTEDELEISQIRVPIGVIGMIYEARPNVTVDAASICLKTGNAVVLKGGKEAIHTNMAIVKILRETLQELEQPADFIQLIESVERSTTQAFMKLDQYIDVLIPRGSERLIKAVVQNATIPVLETGAGNCHIFVDASADQNNAIAIIDNAKTQRPSVCNSVEKVLVHKDIASEFLPKLYQALTDRVSFKGCAQSQEILQGIERITEEELKSEFLDYILGLIVVDDTASAINHINHYSSSHSESILTQNTENAEAFLAQVTSSTVYHNVSTRFTDGGKFGYGAEIGISTSKLHARGPMGLREMTTIKNVVRGDGQIRK